MGSKSDETKTPLPFQCSKCNASFSKFDKSLEERKDQITPVKKRKNSGKVHKGKKSFKCDKCDAVWNRRDFLERHISAVHEKRKPFKCEQCDMSFAHKETL